MNRSSADIVFEGDSLVHHLLLDHELVDRGVASLVPRDVVVALRQRAVETGRLQMASGVLVMPLPGSAVESVATEAGRVAAVVVAGEFGAALDRKSVV